MLSGKDIKKNYGGRAVLSGVDLFVHPGRITVLIGPSGSGKTTLIKALSLLEPPDSGRIEIDERAFAFPILGRKGLTPPWPGVTVVFQQHFLWPHLTLRENILLPVKNRLNSYKELVSLFRMADFIDRYPNEVSLGERQRAALARAFILNPKYILLDEITSALDIEQTAVVLGHLLELRERGIGILVVTHHLAFARNLLRRDEGDQIAFMENGSILACEGNIFFKNQQNPRILRFLSAMEIAGP